VSVSNEEARQPVTPPLLQDLAVARVRLPQHVVHREFVEETVVLNLRTGKYHGLNPTAGRMLEVLDAAPSVADAVATLAGEYATEPELVQRDVVALCRGLLERGLIEVDGGEAD
jgi:hypothetical protein